MKAFYPIVFLLFISTFGVSQYKINGTISDQEGTPLAYATISLKNGTQGTTSNLSGAYALSLEKGINKVTFQYIGYQTKIIEVTISNKDKELNVVLEEEAFQLSEIVIAADAEDPAYAVMRKAIKSREKHKKWIQSFVGDLYIKGQIKTLDAPRTFMGEEVGDMEGSLDSNRQGIVYLSESKSTIYYKQPERFKEKMHSSIVSGDNSGFSFNQYSNANFNFYYENINFERSLISPLNDGAMSHYKFKLLGVIVDDQGRQINKIQVIPKDDVRPLFSGLIYILEDEWSIYSLDLTFTGKAIKNKFFDYVRIKQIMSSSVNDGIWYTQNQTTEFKGGFFSFKFGGTFSYFFHKMDLNVPIDDSEFTAEIFSMDEDALDKPSTFWDSIRPIPLTSEESIDYVRKDSIKILRESKPYLDSIDNKNNAFGWTDIIFGYDYNQSYKKQYFSYGTPIGGFRFNAVEGFTLGSKFSFSKTSQDDNRRFFISNQFRYGFSDKQFKLNVTGNYRFSRKKLSWLTFAGGREYFQFDEREAISNGINTWSALYFKKNHVKLFDKRYGRLGFQQEITNGLYGWTYFSYENRRMLHNNTDYSFFKKDEVFATNEPITTAVPEPAFDTHNGLFLNINFRWRPGQKYYSYPEFKARITSEWPTLRINYRKAIATEDNSADYDKLSFRISDGRIGMKNYGFSTLNAEIGTFLTSKNVYFMDQFHFRTNETTVAYFNRYFNGFKAMPFYLFSTQKDFLAVNYEHHFEGYIMDRVPFFKDSGLAFVVGLGGLWKDESNYYEWSVGLKNFGFGPIKIMRLDYVTSYTDMGFYDRAIRLGFTQFFNQVIE